MSVTSAHPLKHIAFHLNCLEQGGAERVVSTLADRFVQEGFDVTIATEWVGENEFVLDPRIRRVHVGLREEDEAKGRVTKALLRIRYLKEFMKQKRPDVLVSFAQKANYRTVMACRGTGVPAVISIRTNPYLWYAPLKDRFIVWRYFDRAAGCVYQTTGQKAFFAPHLQQDCPVILNPVHPKYFDAPVLPKEKSVVQHARLVDFKNQPMLIRAFLRARESRPGWVLRIYGPDSHDGTKEFLEALIAERGAEDCVFLMGGSDALEQEIPKGSVYAFSSDWEGLPNALLEAMAMGMSIVATDCPCGGPATVIEDGVNGLLVPIKDEDAYAAALGRLMDDEALRTRLGAEARKIRERTDIDSIYAEWRTYLTRVCERFYQGE